METRANYIAVGLFSIVAIFATMGVIYWLGYYGQGDDLVPVDVRIQGSVSGLEKGSTVQFNGITVGRVQSLAFDPADPRYVVVRARVNRFTPVRSDTRASIGVRGLSGGAFIQLDGGSPDRPNLLSAVDGAGVNVPVIEGDPSGLTDLVVRANTVAAQVERVMASVERVILNSESQIATSVSNVEKFSQALAQNSEQVGSFLENIGAMSKTLESLSGDLTGTVARVDSILDAVEPDQVNTIVGNVASVTQIIADEREQLSQMLRTLNTTTKRLDEFTVALNSTTGKVDRIVDAISPEQIESIVADVSNTSRKVSSLLEGIETQTVQKTVEDISKTAESTRELVQQIDRNAVRELIDNLGTASRNVSTLLAALDPESINNTVDQIGKAAEGAQTIVADVSKVTTRLGERGGDIDKIFDDATQLAARLNETSVKIDRVVESAQSFFGDDAGQSLVAEARRTLVAFRAAAESLDRSLAQAANGISDVARRGLRDTQTLIRDAGQSLSRIDRVIRKLENNPSAIITGAGGNRIREEGGGRPRR
ncbi:MAG: MlaD family protein [Pseudomonadota bacterium]